MGTSRSVSAAPVHEEQQPSLRDYQIADLAYMIANPKCMLLGDPGTGKTPPVCVMMFHIWQTHKKRTVWVMPMSLLDKNKDEIHRFTPLTDKQVVIVTDPKKLTDGQRTLMEAIKCGVLTKPESCKGPQKTSLGRLIKEGLVEHRRGQLLLTDNGVAALSGVPREFLRDEPVIYLMGFQRFAMSWHHFPKDVKAMFIDEFHLGFGGHNSNRTQQMYLFNEKLDWYVPMTGTLINGRLDTAYPAIHCIEPLYYPSHDAFMNYHAFLDEYDRPIWWQNHEKLSEILGRHGIRRTFEMVYGKSKVVILPEVVTMSEPHRKMYDELHEDAYLELEDFFVDGTLPGVNTIRCRQLMEHPNNFPNLLNLGGFVDTLPGEEPAKLARLRILIQEHIATNTPIVIFSSLIPQQKQVAKILEEYKVSYGMMNGETSPKERSRIDQDFRAARIQALICSPPIAGVGYNWQFWGDHEVEHVMFLTLDYQDTSFAQAIRRFERGPRKTSLRVSIFQYRKSIDQRVMEIVRVKSKLANMVDATRTVFDFAVHTENDEKEFAV